MASPVPPASEPLRPLLVRAVAQALMAIFYEQAYADKVIEAALRQNPKAGSRDRAFIAETTYEVVRHFRLYTELLGRTPSFEPDFWALVGIHFLVRPIVVGADPVNPLITTLPDWREFQQLQPGPIFLRAAELRTIRKFRESIPDWLDALGEQELPGEWDATLAALNQPARVVLRTNRLKTDRPALQAALLEEGVETVPAGDGDALLLVRRQNVFKTKVFHAGWFEMQDLSSQQVATFVAPAPGMRVVDACAGGGGKTLHLAALLQNRGSIIALDTVAWKLDELRTRARRAGATNIEARAIESRKTIKRIYGSADRLLLDVPCSGLGVLRRNPDAKWKLQPAQIDSLHTTQQDILQAYSPITKIGGQMVYATCSVLPSENQAQVSHFLDSPAGKNFRLLAEKRILPQDEGFDGFYMARLERGG